MNMNGILFRVGMLLLSREIRNANCYFRPSELTSPRRE